MPRPTRPPLGSDSRRLIQAIDLYENTRFGGCFFIWVPLLAVFGAVVFFKFEMNCDTQDTTARKNASSGTLIWWVILVRWCR